MVFALEETDPALNALMDELGIVGDVAESWEVSEDELTWTFHLRKGVKFHSGKELTAEDVKATYDRLLNKEDPVRYTQTMGFIDHCDIVDDYTINLVTLEPAGPMLASLTLRANTLLNKDYIEKYGKELGKEVESVDGTGPFKLVEWNKDEDMHLVRFDDYFNGPAATFPKPLPAPSPWKAIRWTPQSTSPLRTCCASRRTTP